MNDIGKDKALDLNAGEHIESAMMCQYSHSYSMLSEIPNLGPA